MHVQRMFMSRPPITEAHLLCPSIQHLPKRKYYRM
jgi:hypothetical protein